MEEKSKLAPNIQGTATHHTGSVEYRLIVQEVLLLNLWSSHTKKGIRHKEVNLGLVPAIMSGFNMSLYFGLISTTKKTCDQL